MGAVAAQKMQLIKDQPSLFSMSDDRIVMKQILGTHAPDGRDVDVESLLHVVEDILNHASATPTLGAETVEDKVHHGSIAGTLEPLADTIHKLTCEVSCKCSGGGDVLSNTLSIFKLVESYSWDSKLVLALAGFSLFYGEFCLTSQLYTLNNPLARSMALLKHLPDILEHMDTLKPGFDALNNLIKAMLDVTKCIIQFKDFPSDYISPDTPPMSEAMTHIPTAVYWTIRGVVACSSEIVGLVGIRHEYKGLTIQTWELSRLVHEINNIHAILRTQLTNCKKHIDDKKIREAFLKLKRLFNMNHKHNMNIINALIPSGGELHVGTTQRKVIIDDVLKRKIVKVFISDLDLQQEELFYLVKLYKNSCQTKVERNYEVVWLPVVDRITIWTEEKINVFNNLAGQMPWYVLSQPTLLEPSVIKYIREEWNFDKNPKLVELDQQGRVTSTDALYMAYLWGSLDSRLWQTKLQRMEKWSMDFLVGEIDHTMLTWIREGRFVCLYGGDNIEWIRQFVSAMKYVQDEEKLALEMVYVGKSSASERMKKNISIIGQEMLSHTWKYDMIWHFWARLKSIWHFKNSYGKTAETDQIMPEVVSLLSFDGSDDGWALISQGSDDIVKSGGKKVMSCLEQFDTWKINVETEGFLHAIRNALVQVECGEHCTHFILPSNTAMIQDSVLRCVECKRPMEKYILYKCCKD